MESYINLVTRDLDKLKMEITAFTDEENLWIAKEGVTNSAGNLCLHLLGNLNHFIGAVIGESGYERDRNAEFEDKHINRQELLTNIDATKQTVSFSLGIFDVSRLKTSYPINVFNEEMSYEYFLIHLIARLSYHLGQINYVRRILEP